MQEKKYNILTIVKEVLMQKIFFFTISIVFFSLGMTAYRKHKLNDDKNAKASYILNMMASASFMALWILHLINVF